MCDSTELQLLLLLKLNHTYFLYGVEGNHGKVLCVPEDMTCGQFMVR